MTRIQRLAARRRRRRTITTLITFATLLATTGLVGAASADTEQPATVVGDYNHGDRWHDSMSQLCVQDETHGFPVEQATREFAEYVAMDVRDDCAGETHVIHVVTINDPDKNAGHWYSNTDGDGRVVGGRIEINVSQAYRMDPHLWRLMITHEFGHAVGLEHTYEVTSIMNPDARFVELSGLTDLDRAQLAEVWQ